MSEETTIVNNTTTTKSSYGTNLVKFVILSGWVLSLVATLSILFLALYLMMYNLPLPEPLTQWASVAIGFVFGSIVNIAKDFVNNQTN